MHVATITGLLGSMGAERLRDLLCKDPKRIAWLQALASDGLPPAQVCYGRMLLEGTGVPKDTVAALQWFGRAAAAGDLDGVNLLGRCYEHGWGTVENLASAFFHFKRAADAGHAWAQYNVGHLYLDGRGTARDAARACAYYAAAASQGHERAMNLLGRCSEEGWGTLRDLQAAADWYRRSAERGYFRGQYNWATLLLRAGRVREAVEWFRRAMEAPNDAVRRAAARVLRLISAPPSHRADLSAAI